ncbi:3337_t:CDS:2, partial [Dentiscutata heterogama]
NCCTQTSGLYVYFRPLGSEFMKYVGKYIRFSHTIIQYGERFYELLPRSNKVQLLEHHILPLKDYTCSVHIKQDQIVNGFNYKELREFFEDMPYKLLERTLKGYIDYYFRPEYETMGSASAQIEDMWDSIEQIYPKVQFKVSNFVSIDKSESAFLDYFTDFSFVEDTKKIYNKYRDNRKTVWFPLINLVKHRHVSFVGKKIYRDIDHNLNIPDKKTVILDLQAIQDYYVELFEIPIDLNIYTKQTKLDDEKEDEITKAVYNQLRPILENSTLMSLEEVLKKWHIAYSWGFPYRFLDGNENMSRQKGDIAIPSVSHVFLKDEVLKLSKVKIEEKIRSIIAMDLLTYFNGMLVNGCQNKNFDPMNGCTIGMFSAHAIPSLIFEQHRSYKIHLQMDITSMDSTMSYNYMRILMKVRILGYANYPQRERVELMMKTYYDNLYNSYLWTSYDGEVRMKHRGHSTGQSTVSPDNTIYCLTLFVEAWKELTGMPAEDFFKYNKITVYGDDNVLSSNCFNDKWNENTLCDYFAQKGISLRLKNKSEGLEGVEFLSKIYSDSEKQLEEVLKYVPDYACKTYLLECIVGLANNCAHYPDIHEICVKYYNELIEAYYSHMKAIRKRCSIKSYEEVIRLQYEYRYNELVTLDMSPFEQFICDACAFIHEVDFKCEFVFQNYKNMLKVFDLSLPKASVDTLYFDPDNHPISENFLIERWIYVNANCPESLGEYLIMVKESLFASICSPQKFFQIRHNFNWDMSSLIELSNHMLGILIASLVVNYLENLLLKFPIIRTFIKLSKLHTNFGFMGFADLNFLYWTMFDRSSLELSTLVPRDPAANKKAIMYLIYDKLFERFDMPDYSILPFLKLVMTKFIQLINLCWPIMADFDLNAIYKIKPFFDNKSFSGSWAPLDHSDSVEKVLEELKKGKIPV